MPGIWTSSVTTCGSKERTSSRASAPFRASRMSKSPSSRKDSFEQFPHQRGIVGDEKPDHETFDACSRSAGRTWPARPLRPDRAVAPDRPARIIRSCASRFATRPISASAPATAPARAESRRAGTLTTSDTPSTMKPVLPPPPPRRECAGRFRFRRRELEPPAKVDDRNDAAAQIHHAIDERRRLGSRLMRSGGRAISSTAAIGNPYS